MVYRDYVIKVMSTVLVEIIRDSKNNFFFRDRELFKLLWSKFQDRELLGSRIIRHVRIRIRVRIRARKSSRDLYRERRRRCGAGGREGKDTQSSIEAPLPAGQVPSPRSWSEVRLGRPRSGKTSKRIPNGP